MACADQGKRGSANGYANAVLTVTAVALVAVSLQLSGGAPAHAQSSRRGASDTGDPLGIPNAFAQRQQMIQALQSMDQRMRALEARLGAGAALDVRVVNIEEITTATVDPNHEE